MSAFVIVQHDMFVSLIVADPETQRQDCRGTLVSSNLEGGG